VRRRAAAKSTNAEDHAAFIAETMIAFHAREVS